jgi:hypothetical protein
MDHAQLASAEAVARTIASLKDHNIQAEVVNTRGGASAGLAHSEGSEVMVGT